MSLFGIGVRQVCFYALQVFVTHVQYPSNCPLSHTFLSFTPLPNVLSICLFLHIARQTLPSVPTSLPLACPLPFHPDDPATTHFLLSAWPTYLNASNHCPFNAIFTPFLQIYRSHFCFFFFFFSALFISIYLVSLNCSLHWSCLSVYSAIAQMPGLVCNSCLAMCHYQVLPPLQGRVGGVSRVEDAEWISHEYSSSFGRTTKQKMAPQKRLHPLKKIIIMGKKGGRAMV